MTNLEIFNYLQLLTQDAGIKSINGVKANYGIVKNIKLLSDEIDLARKLLAKIEGYEEYNSKLSEIEVNKSTNPDINVDEEIKKLKEEYKDAVEKSDEILNAESEYNPYKIKLDNLPSNLDSRTTSILFQLIEE